MLTVLYFASLALSTLGASLIALSALPKPSIEVVYSGNDIFISWQKFQRPNNVLKYIVKYSDGQREFREEADSRATKVRLLYVRSCTTYQAKMMYQTATEQSPPSDERSFEGPTLAKPPSPDFDIEPHSEGRIARWTRLDESYRVYKYTIIGRSDDGLEADTQDAPPNVDNWVLDQFDPNRAYNITMTATNECWTSDESEPVAVDAIPEPKPPIVTVQATSSRSITLWIEPLETDLWLKSFVIDYSTPTGMMQETESSTSATPIELTKGLAPCFNHTVSVRAVTAVGQSEPTVIYAMLESNEVPDTPQFTKLTVSPANRYVVHWTTVSTRPLVGHRIEYSTDADADDWHVAWADGNSQSAELGRLQKCREHFIRIWAANECGWSKSPAIQKQFILPKVPPSVPQNLSGTGNANEFNIRWAKPSSDEDVESYDLLLVPANQQPAQSYWVEGKSTSLPLPRIEQGLRYDVRINARNACGWSDSGQWEFTLSNESALV